MLNQLNRRDILKLGAVASASLPGLYVSPHQQQDTGLPNILFLVFDAMSAKNLPLHGYSRQTTPTIDRLAQRATVFHQHYAAGNFTVPGTTSLLTGTYPWKHRGFSIFKGIHPEFHKKNIFKLFTKYHRWGYSHNLHVDNLFKVMKSNADRFTPRNYLFHPHRNLASDFLPKDEEMAGMSWWLAVENLRAAYSPFFSRIINLINTHQTSQIEEQYPLGLPSQDGHEFYFESAVDWTISRFSSLQEPFLGYLHYFPPHSPYHTRIDFVDLFKDDGYEALQKPDHVLSQGHSQEYLDHYRQLYDEFILFVDHEIDRIFEALDSSGILENTIVILTSDHGEMFERGIENHYHPSLHQPVIQIPLLIFMPGQTGRVDIHSPTSAVDLLPTLLHLTGEPIPEWIEGEVMPPFSQTAPHSDRAVYALEAKDSKQFAETIFPISLMVVKNGYKLTYYEGWNQMKGADPIVELFAIEDDPEEMNNLADENPEIRDELLSEVLAKAKGE